MRHRTRRPGPAVGAGQVVVEVAVTGITFVETQIRRGVDKWHAKPSLPYVPGGLVAGQVSSVGAQVDPAWLGRRVIAGIGETGGFAERAVAAVEELFPVPDGLGLPEAVALHSDGSTAQGLIEKAEIGRAAFEVTARGGRFSVHGASSGEATLIDPTEAGLKGVDVLGIEQLFGFGPNTVRWAQQMMSQAATGLVRPVIGQTFPLERAADAHAAIENRTALGKTLLLI